MAFNADGPGRRQPRQARAQAGGNAFAAPFPQQPVPVAGYYGTGFYDPNAAPGPQLFDDTSNSGYAPADYYQQQQQAAYGAPQGAPFGGYMHPGQGPVPGGGIDPGFMNQQQFLMMAGSNIVQTQVGNAVNYYSANIVDKGKSWVGSHLKYYFAVDTAYVLKKLMLIFFPFTHKEWAPKYSPNEPVAPRDDLNTPDLYIPSMAFVTYVLVAGFLLGLENRFTPELLGIQASSALAWLLMEVVFILISLYLMSISCSLGFFHLLSYCSYKFVCMIGALLLSLLVNNVIYYAFLAYSSIALGFFLMRSLHVAIQTSPTHGHSNSRNGLYLVFIICGSQALLMYWLTRHLVSMPSLSPAL